MTQDPYERMRDLLDSGRTDPGVEHEARALITQILSASAEPPSRPLPVAYGSPAWHKLPDADPRKGEALVDAAESWRTLVQSPYATEILSAYFEWDRRRIISEWSGEVAEQNRGRVPGPSYRELEHRRTECGGQAWRDFVERHGGDYLGGRVDWETGQSDAGEAA